MTRTYRYHSQHKTKTAAKNKAKELRRKGRYAITKKIMANSFMVYATRVYKSKKK